ncbi:phytoene desaturase family protein [Diaminobutyricibacter sp. McL0608]|uniref:phytoene desaturase family protein n=1 Tax=Leifsonia sp. McL0608 TaxID=3143537 RepID=UPI0031F2E4F8
MIDATVVGSGPNGLAAAVTLARAGLEVVLVERAPTVGGGMRTAELTLPGFRHDVCSAVHPAALASPFFRAFGLTERVPFVIPSASYAHPLDRGVAGIAWHDLDRTVEDLGRDGNAWRSLFGPLVDRIASVTDFTGSQLLRIPPHPFDALVFGLRVLEQGTPAWNERFRERIAPAMLSGVSAHAIVAQPSLAAAGTGLLLGAHAHAAGWGFPVGGSQAIADALADDLRAHGGRIVLDTDVGSPADLEPSRVTLLDTSPEFLAGFAGDRLPAGYQRALRRFPRGPGVAKVDFALSEPVPWTNPDVALAPTVHLGGSRGAIARSEREVLHGRIPSSPFVLVTQPSILDDTRAPAGKHTLWAYVHVPAGSIYDPTEAITRQVERVAPGFRDTILASSTMTARDVEANNPNDVGGEIMGGAMSVYRLVDRPVLSPTPWETPVDGLYLCSASTPPGPSVQGMNGWYAARLAARKHFGVEVGFDDLRPDGR